MRGLYVLSSGEVTDRIETYVLDLIRINLIVWPIDIPFSDDKHGFSFSLSDVRKSELKEEVTIKITELIGKITSKFDGLVKVRIDDVQVNSESSVSIILGIGHELTEITLEI